jgi:hypothetical protein
MTLPSSRAKGRLLAFWSSDLCQGFLQIGTKRLELTNQGLPRGCVAPLFGLLLFNITKSAQLGGRWLGLS